MTDEPVEIEFIGGSLDGTKRPWQGCDMVSRFTEAEPGCRWAVINDEWYRQSGRRLFIFDDKMSRSKQP